MTQFDCPEVTLCTGDDVNHFTAPALKMSGLKDAQTDAPTNKTFSGPIMHLLPMIRVLMTEILSHASEKKKKKKREKKEEE